MADLADVARGLESGLTSFLTRQAREREEERRKSREERRQAEHEARMRDRRNQRTIQEADAASRGIELEGVETVEPGGPQAYGPEGRELNVTDAPREGLEARPREGETPLLSGERGLMEGEVEGMAAGEGRIEPRAAPGANAPGAQQALSEEFQRSARAGPGADPDVEAGAIDPETGTFASEPVFRGEGGGPSIGSVLREGEVRQEDPSFRLSSGQRFTPGSREERILQEEVNRIMQARPDLSQAEAELLARDETQALTFDRGREEGLDETFNIRGREFTDRDEAVNAYRAFQDEGGRGGGRGGENLTQKEELAVQYGFTQPDGSPDLAGYERFQDRVGSLQQVYGNTQGDPLLQRAVEARAMGLSETDVLDRITRTARERDFSQAQIEQIREDVRGFFSQRSRRQIQRLQEGDLSGPNFGSGFDLDFGTTRPDSAAGGGGGEGVGAMRGGGGGGR